MQVIDFKVYFLYVAMSVLLSACALQPPPTPPGETPTPLGETPTPPGETPAPQPEVVVTPPPVPKIDPMADMAGDKPAPLAPQGALERIDCRSGEEFLHARMSFEARGGQVSSFAYYSVWKPRTCAFDFARNSPGVKWRITSDGATRVQTPQGRFLIRTRPDAYVFEFDQVDRYRYCGMSGEINGSMTISRGRGAPKCSVAGIMDANDALLDRLKQAK